MKKVTLINIFFNKIHFFQIFEQVKTHFQVIFLWILCWEIFLLSEKCVKIHLKNFLLHVFFV